MCDGIQYVQTMQQSWRIKGLTNTGNTFAIQQNKVHLKLRGVPLVFSPSRTNTKTNESKKTCTLTLTSMVNLQSPISLHVFSGRRPEYPERTYT